MRTAVPESEDRYHTPMPSREVSLIDLVLHELRTPLTVAAGSLRQLGPLADTTQQAALARALRACDKLERLAQDMRDWTRLQGSAAPIDTVTLLPVVEAAARDAEATRAGEIRVITQMPADVMAAAPARFLPGALTTLLTALIRAAVPGESIAVEGAVEGSHVRLRVRRPVDIDLSGDGFEAEWTGGLGFSMPLARAVIESAGGRVASHASADGRLVAISVWLETAGRQPSR